MSTKSAPVTAAIHQATPSALVVAPSKKTAVKTASEAPAPSVLSSAPIEAQEATTDEKSADKKKKKDDLKIDRTGDLEAQWKVIAERFKSLKPVPYKMSENYEARTVLMHKVLGWGFVLTSLNNRLEVLFKDGIKILVSNYKAN